MPMSMTQPFIDNSGEKDYQTKIQQIATTLSNWQGPIVLISHVDPDGDAVGSSLALKRALAALGKETKLPLVPPRFLEFLVQENELSPELKVLPDNCLLVVLDAADEARAVGAPLSSAAFTINVDHHGTNTRFGDIACVQPSRAATAQMVKDIIDASRTTWTAEIATPCLTGIITDTGNFRFGNTSPDVLADASELIAKGVAYAELVDQLQIRHPDYFRMLGKVMSTIEFPLNGLVAMARITGEMRDEIGPSDDDSDDYVGLIRYAEGTQLAIFLKDRGDHTKVSVRSRGKVSAQAICLELGGGGHVAAAGATVQADLGETRRRALAAAKKELLRQGFKLD